MFGHAVIPSGRQATRDLRAALPRSTFTPIDPRRHFGETQGDPEILRGVNAPKDDNASGAHSRPEAGVSLLELLVVLVLLGLMAAVVAPSLASLDAPVATTPADEVVRLFADARRDAVESARLVELRVDLGTGGYRLLAAGDADAQGKLRAGGQLRLTNGAETGLWRFTPDGRVLGPALSVMGEKPRMLRFDPGTGELLP